MEFLELIKDFNIYSVLIRIVLSAIIGGIIGFERGIHGRAAGLRTHILVSVGSTITALVGIFSVENAMGGDAFRISAQVVSGIGFLGVGMILVRNRTDVTGLTTAACIWTTSIIGIAVGYGFYSGALIATLLCFASITLLGHFEKRKNFLNIYLEVSETCKAAAVVQQLREIFNNNIKVSVVSPKSSAVGHIGILIVVKAISVPDEKLALIEKIDGVDFFILDCNT